MNKWKGNYFKFHTCIIESGIWAKLLPSAKALYLALLSRSYFPSEYYFDAENLYEDERWCDVDVTNFMQIQDVYKVRKWEYCEAPACWLCEFLNISESNASKIINNLEENGLVSRMEFGFIVYLIPEKI